MELLPTRQQPGRRSGRLAAGRSSELVEYRSGPSDIGLKPGAAEGVRLYSVNEKEACLGREGICLTGRNRGRSLWRESWFSPRQWLPEPLTTFYDGCIAC